MKAKKVNQEYSTKPLKGAGSEPEVSAKIGGVANTKTPFKSYKGKGK